MRRRTDRPETRLLFVESPTNPMMEITDIAAAGPRSPAPAVP